MTRTTQADLSRYIRTAWEAKQFLAGIKRRMAGDHAGAMRKMKRILDRNPICWPAVFEVATMAHILCEHRWAVEQLRKLVAAVPNFLEGVYNLGTILQCCGEYAEAEQHLRHVLALDPTFVAAHTNLGNALLGLGRPEEARASFDRALQHEPQDAEANWNLAHALVLTGQWVEGWAKYEYRWKIPGFVEMNAIAVDASRNDLPQPWRGAPLEGKTLIVAEEQGWGDTLMCLRYAPLLRDMGAEVTWAVRPEMLRLAAATVAPDAVCNIREPVPGADYIVTTMTLHHRFGITPATVPGAEGYLKTSRPRRARSGGPLRVGITWMGSKSHRNDGNRSLSRGALKPLAFAQGIEWVCLCREGWDERLADLGMENGLLGCEDWLDTADVVQDLDAVVSVDTALAHLSGGLGVPTYTTIAAVPDMRWGLGSETTPWYKSVRLYRQTKAGEWGPVMERVARDLQTEVWAHRAAAA